MRSIEVIGGVLLLTGVILAVVYPTETIGFVSSIMDSIRWIHHGVPRNM